MKTLKVVGREHVGKYSFTGIEGGFGSDKKSMLVKDIANIHKRPIKAINQAINGNKIHFKDGIDVIDLKIESGSIKLTEFFSKQQIANFNNIYLLSERGYSKLLKILEDDTAWEIYDRLVDNYFNMRISIKEKQPELVVNKRLEIMEQNAATRKAGLLYRIAMATASETSKQTLLANAAKEITGEMIIPALQHKEYSATEVAKLVNASSANKVGRICNKLGLKAEQPGQNEYGRWASSKSKYSNKETPQWLYFDKGVTAIRQAMLKN